MKPLELIEQGRFLGEEFVMWLWYRGLVEGGTSGVEDDLSACFVDDAVVLVNERSDVKELTLRKGNPAESREAFEALSRGMRLAKAKVRFLDGDMEWTCSLNSATLSMSGLKLPPSQAKDPSSRVGDRLFLAEQGISHIERRFKVFLKRRTEDVEGLHAEMMKWISASIAGANGEEDTPWTEEKK